MITVKGLLFEEKKETFREFLDRKIQLGYAGHDDGSAEVAWSNHSFDETYLYDFEEQVYKKRKVYFHISNASFSDIDARIGNRGGHIPAAYFAMDATTCLDFARHKFKDDVVFLHRCVNNRAMNLFNPSSAFDLTSLDLDSENKNYFYRWLQTMRRNAGAKNIRYWDSLEQTKVMDMIYNRTVCDGIALDFYVDNITRYQERTEGFCLFDRGVSAIKIIDTARIDIIDNFDAKKAIFWPPESDHLRSNIS